MQRCTGMATVINNELQTQCGGTEQSWMENVFCYQLICANTKDTILAYENAIQTARSCQELNDPASRQWRDHHGAAPDSHPSGCDCGLEC
eukprot:1681812-Amphidinium_carterae.1